MTQATKIISTVEDYSVVEIFDQTLHAPRYFIVKDGEVISKGFATSTGAISEIDLIKARKLYPSVPVSAALGINGGFVTYPIGRAILRALSRGKYPPDGPHNAVFVAFFPYLFLIAALVAVTVIYS